LRDGRRFLSTKCGFKNCPHIQFICRYPAIFSTDWYSGL